ncbi:hypothetical protein ACI2LJ_27825 [Streptomyces sp. NPDC088090]|uniref:hypothetical protein n=1 Tax=Streptomyces sp. NPDC088090 TaxID=3365822 RepID=UPI00384B4016
MPIQIGGQAFALAWRPAAEWTTVRTELDVIRLLPETDQDTVGWMILEGETSFRSLADAAHSVLETVTGRRWWEGIRLLMMSVQPETLGHLALAGVDPWQRSAYEWCAATYALHTRNADEKARMRFDFQLGIPPRGYEDEWGVDGGDNPEDVQKQIMAWTGG